MNIPLKFKRPLFAAMIGALTLSQPAYQAHAFALPVFDAGAFGQNIVDAAKTLQQINNQISQLQNDAQMLINQAKNLIKLPGLSYNFLRLLC